MDAATIVQQLIGDGFNLRLSDDGEKILVDTTHATLTEQHKTMIRDNKVQIIEYMQRKAWSPKVARGAIHYILHRSQHHLNRVPTDTRYELISQLVPKLEPVWQAVKRQNRWQLRKALMEFHCAVYSSVKNVAVQPTP